MKHLIIISIFVLTFCNLAFAQSRLPELDKAKQIKMLVSTREDVKRILAGYEAGDSDAESFSTKNADIEISYSTGDCSNKKESERWNVSKGRVKFMKVSLENPVKLDQLGYDISEFQKEKLYETADNLFVYHSKDLGVAFEVDENEVEDILIFPTINNYPLLCHNETGKEFYSSESWFDDSELREQISPGDSNPAANVDNLILSATEILTGCNDPKICVNSNPEISVTTEATDPDNDVLTYNYIVTGGEIVGKGAKVMWDLSYVAPGNYTITAGVDDGCGICGQTKSKTVVVKECPKETGSGSEKIISGEEKQKLDTEKPPSDVKKQITD